ncbi:potassium channel family protein [Scatolibacter rhodanostii]|uniref:potassium channel family protein n=1 Tax=Scatolibacter rhodanostii TaxID=2014781 RepID=UPI0013563F28|nr:TrkA family potassium uptake protein [Scatolibacter rhodanostii]
MKRILVQKDTQFAVLGLSKFGKGIAATLYDNGYNVLCCDRNEAAVHDATEYATHIVQADVTDKLALQKMGLSNFDVVIIAFSSDFESAAITATILKELKVKYIIAKANGVRQKQILESIGVDRVILPEKEMGEQMAYNLITNDLMESIHRSDKYDIIEMRPLAEWVGKTLEQLKLRQREGINIMAIIRDEEIIAVLDAKTRLLDRDHLIVLKSI